MAAPVPLTPLDLVTGLVWGEDEHWRAPVIHQGSLRGALEDVVREAFELGPVAVSFSGGRDSSAVLAIAASVARAGGHPPPVPVTLFYPGDADADESDWQDLVLAHLKLKDRIRVEVRGELDLLASTARQVLLRHGLLWPANGFSHAVMLDRVQGSTLLTGGGGDELFANSVAPRLRRVLAGRERPQFRDPARIAAALLAPRWRDSRRAKHVQPLPWLSATGAEAFARAFVVDRGSPIESWRTTVRRDMRARSFAALKHGQELLAADRGTKIRHPFLEAHVMMAAARAGGSMGLGSRTAAMRMMVGDLLPEPVLARSTKASFSGGYWARESLAFARSAQAIDVIDADPVTREFVDVVALRREWKEPQPHFLTALLLQAAARATGRLGEWDRATLT